MSVINDDREHVFIHVPKTGGTSMCHLPWCGGLGHERAATLMPKAPPRYLSWAFVRNPYDRLVSVYHAALQHARRWPAVEDAGTFDEFVFRLGEGRWQVTPHALPMAHFLCDDSGALLVDFVGRFEQLEEHFFLVCRLLGVEQRLPHRNPSIHPAWESLYTPELAAVVDRVYEADFRLFGYEKFRGARCDAHSAAGRR